MTKIKIRTTQNIDIEYELATIFDRILAWLVDFMVIGGYIMIAWIGVASIWHDPDLTLLLPFFTPGLLYHFFAEWLMNGQSIGKMALRIRVVRLDGSPPTIGNYMARWIFRPLETSPIALYGSVGISAVAFSEKGQRIGDMVAGTTVIRTDRRVSMADTILARNRSDYQPAFVQVQNLLDRDIATIKDVLRIYRRERNRKLLNACANHVCHALSIVPPNNMNAEQFLRNIVRDYSYYS